VVFSEGVAGIIFAFFGAMVLTAGLVFWIFMIWPSRHLGTDRIEEKHLTAEGAYRILAALYAGGLAFLLVPVWVANGYVLGRTTRLDVTWLVWYSYCAAVLEICVGIVVTRVALFAKGSSPKSLSPK
jgi:hypothetical protein